MSDTISLSEQLAALLAQAKESGIDLGKELAEKRKADRALAMAGAKEAATENRATLIGDFKSIRETLVECAKGWSPGSYGTVIARKKKDGTVVVTMTDGHASGFKESLHLNNAGDLMTGEDGAKECANVRERKPK